MKSFIGRLSKGLLLLSILLILYFTIFDRHPGSVRMVLSPFWEYRSGRWRDLIIPNIVLFMPFGLTASHRWGWKAVLIGAGLSAAIEITQYIFGLGYTEFDDVFNNTIGTVVGVILYKGAVKLLRRINRKRK